MPLKISDLDTNVKYFVSVSSTKLYETQDGKGQINHLLLGDWLAYKGETHSHKNKIYAKVRCRNDNGWMRLDHFDSERALEVNFVDIGQGDGCHIVTPDDKIMLIDAGESDNMHRFLSWRYNLRGQNVRRAPNFDPALPEDMPHPIDYVVISHPDQDHYGGFRYLFDEPKLSFDRLYHNTIIERPKRSSGGVSGVTYSDTLGGYFESEGRKYVYDHVNTDAELQAILNRHPKPSTKLLQGLHLLYKNSPNTVSRGLSLNIDALDAPTYLTDFEPDKAFSLQILGPVAEMVKFKTKKRRALRRLVDKGKTKNGHSVIFKARYGNLKMLLGGDLNSQSQKFLLQAYSGIDRDVHALDKVISKINAKPRPLSSKDQKALTQAVNDQVITMSKGREVFGVDVAKACHHGSAHITDEFISCLHSCATVISSGDEESHSHPRPDAIGAYGKHGRGERPLIFSTELARSTKEFTTRHSQYLAVRGITLQIEAETDMRKKKALEKSLEFKKDRNVAVYGMITLRALGDTVIMAQKLERDRKIGATLTKWDIYELKYDADADQFGYDPH